MFSSSLFDLQSKGAHQFAPPLHFRLDHAPEFLGRRQHYFRAQPLHALADFRRAHRFMHRGVQQIDDGAQRVGRREQAKDGDRFVSRHAGLGDGRNFRRDRRAFGARDAERAQASGLNVRQRRRRIREHDLHLARQHVS